MSENKIPQLTLNPTETAVEFEYKDGYTEITLPEILGYAMFVLRK